MKARKRPFLIEPLEERDAPSVLAGAGPGDFALNIQKPGHVAITRPFGIAAADADLAVSRPSNVARG